MKKVLYFHHGDISGGAPRSLRFLLEKLDDKEYEVTVVCRTSKKDLDFFRVKNADVILEKRIRPFHGSTVSGIYPKQIAYNFFYALPTYFAAKKIIRSVQPDIIHLNSSCLFMCARAAKHVNKNIKVICHIREPLLPNIWGTLLRIGNYKAVDRFIAIDQYDGSTMDPQHKKTTVIYNFVDFTLYNNNVKSNILREELNLSESDVIFLCLCRVSPENGIDEAVTAWTNSNIPNNAHLVIVGEIKNREVEYTQRCHMIAGKKQNIHFLPFRTDIPSVIAASDVMLCTFTEPHFARSIIEGAAMGKPAISKLIDGPKELIIEEKTGIFYNFNNKALYDCVLQMMDKQTRKKMGTCAVEHAIQHFNADINAEKTFKEYL